MIEHMFQELWNFFIEFPRLSLAPIWERRQHETLRLTDGRFPDTIELRECV
jgi:hypothetical protein